MKKAGATGRPASSISTSATEIIALPPSFTNDETPASASLPNDDARPLTVEDEIDALLTDLPFEFPDSDDPLANAVVVHVDPEGHAKRVEISNLFPAAPAEKPSHSLQRKPSRPSARKGTSVYTAPTPTPLPAPTKRKTFKKVEPFKVEHSRPGLPQRWVPVRWEKLDRVRTFVMFDRAIEALGPRVAITINLHPDREAHYRNQTSTASKMLADISKQLRREFGRPIPVALALQETEAGRLHAHGVLGIDEKDAERARAAIRRGVGPWDKNRQFQVLTDDDIDEGWVGYSLRDRNDPRLTMDRESYAGRFREIAIGGQPYAVSNPVRRKAADLYNAWRDSFISRRRAAQLKQ